VIGHSLRTVDDPARELHPCEVALVAWVTSEGGFVRLCDCGAILCGVSSGDVVALFHEHLRWVRATGGGAA
jgi:hypothetical protein